MRSALDTTLPVTDLSDPVMYADPFPRYAELRRTAPVSLVKTPLVRKMGYMATRFDDVMAIHTDRRFSSDVLQHGPARFAKYLPRMFRLLTDSMVFKDDPDHKRLRGLVNKAFTPKRVQEMADDIERMVENLVDDLDRREDAVDLVEEFAVALPLSVIAAMLGVSDRDRDQFHAGVKQLVEGFSAGPAGFLRALPTTRRLMKLFDRLAAERRADPDDHLITALVRANDEGDRLADDEVIAMIFLLLLAGHDTTANLIGNGVLALLDNPGELQRLRDRPELIDTAVEELLRYTSPVTCGAARFALDEVELSGFTIPKGGQVLGMIIAANHDEEVFEDPDRLDLGRDPNRHIAFAFGAHYCLGNQLARMEGRFAINALVQRFPRIELAMPRADVRYKPTPSLRGPRTLPLHLG